MATRKGLEPSTSGVTGRRSNRLSYRAIGRGSRDRTHGTRFWRPLLYQLSYTPISGFFRPARRRCEISPKGQTKSSLCLLSFIKESKWWACSADTLLSASRPLLYLSLCDTHGLKNMPPAYFLRLRRRPFKSLKAFHKASKDENILVGLQGLEPRTVRL